MPILQPEEEEACTIGINETSADCYQTTLNYTASYPITISLEDSNFKADTHIACRAHTVPLPCGAVRCRAVNSHTPRRASAMLR